MQSPSCKPRCDGRDRSLSKSITVPAPLITNPNLIISIHQAAPVRIKRPSFRLGSDTCFGLANQVPTRAECLANPRAGRRPPSGPISRHCEHRWAQVNPTASSNFQAARAKTDFAYPCSTSPPATLPAPRTPPLKYPQRYSQ